jgi:sterol desaturase/sphingolipid hydroxylase (fatty acid hydroxylase superfamily)
MIANIRQAIRNDLEPGAEAHHFGTGWISGTLALILGGCGFLLLLSQQYPAIFSAKELHILHGHPATKLAIQGMALCAFILACINLVLRRNKILGFSAIVLVLSTTILGFVGSFGTVGKEGINLGLDWFVLNLLLKGVLFVPLEKLFSKDHQQPLFRDDWREDLFYFLFNSLFVQILAYLSLLPSMTVLAHTPFLADFRQLVASQPVVLQFIEIMIIADLMQYCFHRLFHQIPALWKFHAVHHSAKAMDWMAGSRMHIVEVIALRAITILPIYAMGFAQGPLYAYILIVFFISAYVHANIRLNDRWLAPYFVTPRFHHWHHGIEKEAIDVNFAIHFPWIDKLFGTYHMPDDKWPSGYGIGGHPVPDGYVAQALYPFQKDKI